MKSTSSILILLIATTAILFATQVHCQASITQAVSDALDAAVQDLTTDTAWIAYYSKNMYFNVPTCAGDMVTANTRPDVDNRVKDVHFQCSFGGASKGWIRTGLEPNKVFNDIYQLNQTGIKVGAYDGTNYATFIKTELTAATYVKYAAVNLQYTDVKNNAVHAIVGDAIAYFDWANRQMNAAIIMAAPITNAIHLRTFLNFSD
ncbi:predicted protein [Naegleria gruberi]|uniref:Predicted protein n=1 Tax=Naegleria gruberi TaxID=5762 RepID=D2VXN0_NAEGR|nr:uncharacterized protein NAEGRDRAFT_53064 [Naegleria gruberi]EFC38534.1 predicted protein [Naegleria gruberi]|eukprot:XP_002671278.1 predicted protein [Naegleria gruberi strain NEG-M]